jgi:hypothetical protein
MLYPPGYAMLNLFGEYDIHERLAGRVVNAMTCSGVWSRSLNVSLVSLVWFVETLRGIFVVSAVGDKWS